MATISHPAIPVDRDPWHTRLAPFAVIAVVVLPFIVALGWAMTQPRADARTIERDIRATAVDVDAHARSMVRIGERITTAAQVSAAADRDEWIAYGAHMVTDGRSLEELAARLRAVAPVAAHDQLPAGSTTVAMSVLEGRWEHLEADGRATAEHGRVMVQMAADLAAGVRSGILSEDDAREIRSAAAGMVAAGERVIRSADLLRANADRLGRWLGLGR